MKKLLILIASILIDFNATYAQGLKYDFDKKVIYSSSISLPQTSPLLKVIQILPELLHRPNANILENYTLKIEGLSVGGSSDAILMQILLADIEKINITSSSTSNYDNNGQGGEINIILKELKPGTSGNAFISLGYPNDYIPGLSLNYRSDKWTVRSFLTGEVYNQEDINSSYYTSMKGTKALGSGKEVNEEDSRMHQMAKIYAFYIDERNDLRFSFSQMSDKSLANQLTHKESILNLIQKDNSKRDFNIMFKTAYKYLFPWQGKFCFEGLYTYNPVRNRVSVASNTDMVSQNDITNHSISGKVEYDQSVGFKDQGASGAHLLLGANYNYSYNNSNADQQLEEFIPSRNTTYRTFYISPYLKAMATLGKFNILANVEYQFYKYKLRGSQEVGDASTGTMSYKNKTKNYIGTFATIWNINPDHILRLLASRTLKRPTESQMFPYMLYSIDNLRLEQGNSELKPMKMNTVELEYLFSHDTEKNHWQATLGGRYIHTTENIQVSTTYSKDVSDYITSWYNEGKDNIFNLNAMFNWKRGWFSFLATGNYFYRHTIGTDTHHTYCNFSLMPQLQSHNWTFALALKHNTKIVQNSVTQPPLTTLGFHLAKTWTRLTAFLSGTLSLNHKIDEKTALSGSGTEIKTYVPVDNSVYAGIRYNF